MQPPPGLSQQDVPPPGLAVPPGLQGPPGLAPKPFPTTFPFFPMFQKPAQFIPSQTLESLGIGLKQDEQASDKTSVQQMRSPPRLNHVAIDTNAEYCYLEPRMHDLLVTSSGMILDSLENNLVGLWDRDFQLRGTFKGLFNYPPGSYRVVPLEGSTLLMSHENLLYLVDLNDGSKRVIWDCNHQITYFDVTGHKRPILYLACNDHFCIWKFKNLEGKGVPDPIFNEAVFNNGNVIKENDDLELLLAMRTKFSYCDNILVMDNGIVLGRNNSMGEVFTLDLKTEELSELSALQGDFITLWAKLGWDTLAVLREQMIMIVEFKAQYGKVIQNLKAMKDDPIQTLVLLPQNNLAAVDSKGEIWIWEIETGRCIKKVTNTYPKAQNHYNLKVVDNETLMLYSNDEKSLQLYRMSLPTLNLAIHISLKAKVRTVEFCQLSPCGRYIFLTQDCGTFRNGEVDFKSEIEVYSINSSNCVHRKRTIEGTLTSTQVTFSTGTLLMKTRKTSTFEDEEEKESIEQTVFHNEPCIQYILEQQKGMVLGQIVQWYFNQDRVVTKDLLLKSFSRCQIYQFDRLVFSYSYNKLVDSSPTESDGFNMFAPTQRRQNQQTQNVSGMAVYNLEQSILLQVKFDSPFAVGVFDMPNATFLYFLNSKNQIEGWNVQLQQLVQKADCRPSTITQIKFEQEQPHMLFTMGQGEWIVRNMRLGLIQKRKTEKTLFKKVEFLDELTCIVLHGKKLLEMWDLADNKVTTLKVEFSLNDFFVYRNTSEHSVIVVGDYIMQKVFSKRCL